VKLLLRSLAEAGFGLPLARTQMVYPENRGPQGAGGCCSRGGIGLRACVVRLGWGRLVREKKMVAAQDLGADGVTVVGGVRESFGLQDRR